MPIQRTRPCPFSQRVGSTIVEQDIDFIPVTKPFFTLDDIVNQEVTNAVNNIIFPNPSVYEQYRSRLTSISFAKAANAKLIAISESLNEAASRELIREGAVLGADEELQKINIEIIEQNRVSAIQNAIIPARDSAVQDAIARYPSVVNFSSNITNYTDTQARIVANRAINNNLQQQSAILAIQSAANEAAESRASSIYAQQVAEAAAAAAEAARQQAEAARQQAEAARIARENADDDGDGIRNIDDRFPNDPTEWNDVNGNGIGDNADNRAEQTRQQDIKNFGQQSLLDAINIVIDGLIAQSGYNNIKDEEREQIIKNLSSLGESTKDTSISIAINAGDSVTNAKIRVTNDLVAFYNSSGLVSVKDTLKFIRETAQVITQNTETFQQDPIGTDPNPNFAKQQFPDPPTVQEASELIIEGLVTETVRKEEVQVYYSNTELKFKNFHPESGYMLIKFFKRTATSPNITYERLSPNLDSSKPNNSFAVKKEIKAEDGFFGKYGILSVQIWNQRENNAAQKRLHFREFPVYYKQRTLTG